MKTSLLIITAASLIVLTSAAQTPTPVPTQVTLPSPTPYQVVERGANHQVWERTVYVLGPSGQAMPEQRRYTELCSGLNFWQNGRWTPSKAEIDLLPPGNAYAAAATNGQQQAWFPEDIYQGVVQLITPDGKQLQSRPVGLFYEDNSNSVLIAVLTNSVGELVGSNQVIYPNAFEGASASMRYTYTRAGFEQDILVQAQLPAPQTFGLDPATTKLEVLTEFLDNNNPVQSTTPVNPRDGLNDTILTFGNMKMVQGRAFSIGGAGQSTSRTHTTPTYKRWLNLNGRHFLLEEVPYTRVAPQLEQLPTTGRASIASTNLLAMNSILNGAIVQRLLPSRRDGQADKRKMKKIQLAKTKLGRKPGLVLDYQIVNGSVGNYDFAPGTYFISGPVYCNDATFAGGAVLKYPNDTTAFVEVDGTLDCGTANYNPAVFTAADDDSVGESVSGAWNGYTGTIQPGGYANPALVLNNSETDLKNVRISYAQEAVHVSYPEDVTIKDSQIVSCGNVVTIDASAENGTITLENCLIGDPAYYYYYDGYNVNAFVDSSPGPWTFNLYFCTVDACSQLLVPPSSGTVGLYAVDSIFSDFDQFGSSNLSGDYNGFDNIYSGPTSFGNDTIDASAGPYTMSGSGFNTGGYYYLIPASDGGPCVGVGTSDTSLVPADVLADIRQKTTQVPWDDTYDIINSQTLNPQAQADTGSSPDLGYHYDRIDYTFNQMQLNGSSLTFGPGTVVGWVGTGFTLTTGQQINFDGTAVNPCLFVRNNAVMELDNQGGNDGPGIVSSTSTSSGEPAVTANFTHFMSLGADFFDSPGMAIAVSATNSEFWNGALCESDTGLSLDLVNCLLNSGLNLYVLSGYPQCALTLVNCTVPADPYVSRNGASSAWPISVLNCAFDGGFYLYDAFSGQNLTWDYNAHSTNGSWQAPQGAHDFNATNFNWQTSWMGNFYLPPDSSLIDKGSTAADQIGLFYFTTQTNQAPEGYSPVDIGYHYVAVDANGDPFVNQDGTPDYLGDPNVNDTSGDGVSDASEAWLGLNPLTSNLTEPSERANYDYTKADWLDSVSGIKSGSITNDPEGNVVQVSQ